MHLDIHLSNQAILVLKSIVVGVIAGVIESLCLFILWKMLLCCCGFACRGVRRDSLASSIQSNYYGGHTSGGFSSMQSKGAKGARGTGICILIFIVLLGSISGYLYFTHPTLQFWK